MRIIAGELRGRRLLPPLGTGTRPITDRVKQSLFDILAPVIPGSRVYDCFAGTGSLGLECLSRGADFVTFFESDQTAVALLRKNIQSLRVMDRSAVVTQNLFVWFGEMDKNSGNEPAAADRAGLVFFDPPYRYVTERADDLRRVAQRIAQLHLSPDAIVVFRHDSTDSLELPDLVRYDQREYGGMTIEFLNRRGT